jgi:DNA mismatch endonuclease (patch repair protein)
MVDKLLPAHRSENMRRIPSKNTKPELIVRKAVRALGFVGYRVHRIDIPGRPDLAWIRLKKAIFVHGCFWHRHSCKEGIRIPKTRSYYWDTKISSNVQRDERHMDILKEQGWSVLVLWECEIRDSCALNRSLAQFL